MLKPETETRYCVKGRMGVDCDWHVIGGAVDEESLKDLVEHQKLTWRYVDITTSQVVKCNTDLPKIKRAKK